MREFTISKGESRFAGLLDTVQVEPVLVRRDGHVVAVVLSPAEYARLVGLDAEMDVSPAVRDLHTRSVKRFAETYNALADRRPTGEAAEIADLLHDEDAALIDLPAPEPTDTVRRTELDR